MRDSPTVLRMRGWRGVEPNGYARLVEPLFASYTEVQDHVEADSNGKLVNSYTYNAHTQC